MNEPPRWGRQTCNLYALESVSILQALAALLQCGSPATAQKMAMAISMDVTIHECVATFERNKDHPDEEWLYLTKAKRTFSSAMLP